AVSSRREASTERWAPFSCAVCVVSVRGHGARSGCVHGGRCACAVVSVRCVRSSCGGCGESAESRPLVHFRSTERTLGTAGARSRWPLHARDSHYTLETAGVHGRDGRVHGRDGRPRRPPETVGPAATRDGRPRGGPPFTCARSRALRAPSRTVV